MKVVKSEKLAKLINKEHGEVLAMVCLIVMKHPSAVKEFKIEENGVLITPEGIELIIDFISTTQGLYKLIDLVKCMTRED